MERARLPPSYCRSFHGGGQTPVPRFPQRPRLQISSCIDHELSHDALPSQSLQAAISGGVFGLGDVTAQAYEGRGVGQVDWLRMARSSLVGLIAGPAGHLVYSSDGSLVDTTIDQLQVS